MTAPVITQPLKMAMTAPVLSSSSERSMAFVLPFEYQHINQIPRPIDSRIKIKEIPKRILASYRYTGSFDPIIANTHIDNMIEVLLSSL